MKLNKEKYRLTSKIEFHKKLMNKLIEIYFVEILRKFQFD